MQINFPTTPDIKVTTEDVAYFLGYKKSNPPQEPILSLINECISQMKKVANPKWCANLFDLTLNQEEISFSDLKFSSHDLSRNLKNCSKVFLVAITAGPQIDFLIRKTQSSDPVKASIFQATGAAFAENTIEELNNQIKIDAKLNGYKTHPRYSPGYGDVPLTLQKDFFRLLPCSKIGLTLMNTLIMAPEKSVTAFIGLEKITES